MSVIKPVKKLHPAGLTDRIERITDASSSPNQSDMHVYPRLLSCLDQHIKSTTSERLYHTICNDHAILCHGVTPVSEIKNASSHESVLYTLNVYSDYILHCTPTVGQNFHCLD